jgi:ABC-type uncharacterized transport system permease subunit
MDLDKVFLTLALSFWISLLIVFIACRFRIKKYPCLGVLGSTSNRAVVSNNATTAGEYCYISALKKKMPLVDLGAAKIRNFFHILFFLG